jgi:hypothetical protein
MKSLTLSLIAVACCYAGAAAADETGLMAQQRAMLSGSIHSPAAGTLALPRAAHRASGDAQQLAREAILGGQQSAQARVAAAQLRQAAACLRE